MQGHQPRPASNDYVELKRRVAAAGLLRPQPLYYWMKAAIGVGTLAAVAAVAVAVQQPAVLLLDAVLFGIATTQVALLAHDVAHRQAWRGRRQNALASLLLGNVALGVSYSWWVRKHNKHHASPNTMDEDPDIRFPMLVFSPDQIAEKRRWVRPIIAVQAYVFVLFLPLQAVALRINSIVHLCSGRARSPWLEGVAMATGLALLGWLVASLPSWPMAVAFLLISQATFGLYNSSIFASNHKGMLIIKPGERMDFLREQVLTSRNLARNPITDFWYGGLNYQIEHHLFPTMARNRLGDAQPIVREFCEERGIPYCSSGLLSSYRQVFQHLNRVSAPLRRGHA